MIERTIATRYARALLALGKESGKVDVFQESLVGFSSLFMQNADLKNVLCNRNFDLNARERVLSQIAQKLSCEGVLLNFLKLLLRKGRMDLVGFVSEEFTRLADEQQGRCPMWVRSAVELPQAQYEELLELFAKKFGKKMILRKKIDTSLLGGLSVQVGDEIFDYSLSRQLNELKQKMAS